jgi:hypothetical protein
MDPAYVPAIAALAARERLTLIRLFEELRALGYEGALPAFCVSIRSISTCQRPSLGRGWISLS